MNETSRHYAAGSEFPVLKEDTLRIYSMRYCPYAQRTRIVLVHKDIPVETVNVNLKRKPDWFLARNPLGLVPILEKNDKIVYESSVCDEYLDDIYPQKKLTPADPYVKARQKILIETFGKVTPAFVKLLKASDGERAAPAAQLTEALKPYEEALTGKFFGGDDLSMLDIHIWPFFERFSVWEESPENPVTAEKLPKMAEYIQNMCNHPTIRATLYDAKTHRAFFKSFLSGEPKYDDLNV